jgi:hypothetical protein
MRPVSPDYGSVFGIPVLRGRFFTTRDTSKSASVAVVSEAMAAKYWPRGNSIGQRITIDKYLGPDFAAPPREIIGVVKDVRDLGMKEEPASMIYVPQAQVPNGMTAIDASILPITWAVRTVSEPYSFRAAVQGTLKDASGGLAVARIRSMEDVVSQSTARSDFNTLLLAVFAAASLVLAAVGIYGLMVFSVQQRIHEIGIRLALGATGNQVRHLLISQGMRLAVAGVILGALASLGLARYMQTLVYSVKPVDIGTIFISSLTLGLVAAFACYIPTRRASRLDPATILRSR